MSLLWKEMQDQEAPQPRRRGRESIKISLPLDLSKLTCRQCTLDKEPLKHPKMPATGAAPGSCIFYALGEAPGKEEDEENEQFVGTAGRLLRPEIPEQWRPHTRWNNSVNCRPPENRNPTTLELSCCRHRVEPDIAEAKPKVILAFGAIALQWLLRSETMPMITFWRGKRLPVRVRGHTCWAYVIGHPAWIGRVKNDKRYGEAHLVAFKRDVATAFADYEAGLPEPFVENPLDYKKGIEALTEFGPRSVARIAERLEEVAKRPDFSIDLETNSLHPYTLPNPKLLSVAVGNYGNTFAFGVDHPDCQWTKDERDTILAMLYRFILSSGRKWAHYLKFEHEWLAFLLGKEIMYKTEWGDTQAQAHALDERPGKELEDITLQHFGFDVKQVMHLDAKKLEQYPLLDVLFYNGLDVKYCDAARAVQAEIIEREGLQGVYERLVRLTPSLVNMQLTGMVRNVPQIVLLNNQLEAEEHKLIRKILENKDVEKFKHTRAKFNPASNKDMLDFFHFLDFKKLKNVDEDALSNVNHPVARLELKRRGERKLRSTYIAPVLDGGKNVAMDGRYHPEYSHVVTVTSRLNSEAHNWPRRERKEIRRAIGTPPGHKFVSADYGQIEARVVAMLSKDETLVRETWNGDDIHGVWTDKIGRRFVPAKFEEPEGREWVRDGIKNLWTFPQIFKSRLYSIAQDLTMRFGVEVSESALQPFSNEFWGKYAGVLRWQEELIASYWVRGYVETLTGFRRHEPMNENEIVNMPVQGTAAQIVLDAQYRIDRLAFEQDKPWRSPMFQGHDDLSFYIPEASLEEDIEWIAREMCLSRFDFINVPLTVEVSIGDNWADKKKLHTFKTADFQ